MTNIYKIAIIGPKDIVSVFKSTGADVFSADYGHEALEILRTIRKQTQGNTEGDRYASVILLENLRREIKDDDYDKAVQGALPAVIVVPGLSGSTGESMKKLRKLAERAVGMDILK